MSWTFNSDLLKKCRAEAGMTQAEVAERCGISLRSYKRWENGEVRPYAYNLKRLARTFGLPNHKTLVISARAGDGNAAKRLAYKDRGDYRIVCFSLDGALLTGADFEFSWDRIWQCVGDGERHQEALIKKYLRGEISYGQWIRTCGAVFRARGLRRDHFADITRGIQLRPGVHQTLAKLKRDGFRLCLVSGSLDVFLYRFLPDADVLFDCVHINRMVFDAAGTIDRIDPTEFDFEGKADAVGRLCTHYDIDPTDAVYVGNSFNDESIFNAGVKTVAFADAPQSVRMKFDHIVDARDCTEMLDLLYRG